MGVLEFFGTLMKIDITSSSIKGNYRERIPVKHFFIDFNSIIHVSSQAVIADVNMLMKIVLANYQKNKFPDQTIQDLFAKYNVDFGDQITSDLSPKNIVSIFRKYFDAPKMDILVSTATINNMLKMVKSYCQDKVLETLMIAIDGVPSKGKMIEQRQRRYISAVIESYKKKLQIKYKKYLLGKPNNIYYATTYAIQWNRTKISPGTRFMYRLGKYLQGKQVTNALHKGRPKLQIVYTGMNEVGEAEKKIVNYISNRLAGTKDRIVIYSPDADMILLCILLPVANVQMLRHNQQASTADRAVYDLIDTPSLKNNIAYYVNQLSATKTEYEPERIARDLVCLSTIFGNDFVPRMESVSVKKGFQNLLDAYQITLLEQNDYLVREKKDRTYLSLTFLKKIIKQLLPVEKDFINNNSLYQRYINIGQIKNVFSDLDVTENTLNGIYQEFTRRYGDFKNAIRNDRDVEHYAEDPEFMGSLKKALMVRTADGLPVNTSYLSDDAVVNVLRDYYDRTGDFPGLNINLNTFTHSIRDGRHRRETKDMNDYEKEKYQFEHMLDSYYVKLNAQPLDLSAGKVPEYYNTYFHVKVTNSKGELTNDGKELCQQYLEGILWVFNYYFNDTNYISTWYYPHERTPLLRHLSLYLDKLSHSEFNELEAGLEAYQVQDLEDYFNPVEQFLYVCPMTKDNIASLPEEFQDAFETDELPSFLRTFYTDVDMMVDTLWGETVSKEIDCRSIPYFNKCSIKGIYRPSASDDKQFLEAVREIPQGSNYQLRAATGIPDY
jgi:5'-3' exonuclease